MVTDGPSTNSSDFIKKINVAEDDDGDQNVQCSVVGFNLINKAKNV